VDLYLIRHADAVPAGDKIADDAERPLSAKGEKQAEQHGRLFKRRDLPLDELIASPLVRAQRTAELMARQLKDRKLSVETTEALAPGAKPRKLAKFLRSVKGDAIGLVGHMPHIAILAAWLIGDKEAQLDFAKAGVACIACGEMPGKGLGTLRWLVTPEWFE
jgi:phosphohistidine phosphatase